MGKLGETRVPHRGRRDAVKIQGLLLAMNVTECLL